MTPANLTIELGLAPANGRDAFHTTHPLRLVYRRCSCGSCVNLDAAAHPTISNGVGAAVVITVSPKWFMSISAVSCSSPLFSHFIFMRGPSPKNKFLRILTTRRSLCNQTSATALPCSKATMAERSNARRRLRIHYIPYRTSADCRRTEYLGLLCSYDRGPPSS